MYLVKPNKIKTRFLKHINRCSSISSLHPKSCPGALDPSRVAFLAVLEDSPGTPCPSTEWTPLSEAAHLPPGYPGVPIWPHQSLLSRSCHIKILTPIWPGPRRRQRCHLKQVPETQGPLTSSFWDPWGSFLRPRWGGVVSQSS